MRLVLYPIIFLVCLLCCQRSLAQKAKGINLSASEWDSKLNPNSSIDNGKFYLFMIAEEKYNNGIDNLADPVKDAEKLKALLAKDYKFDSVKLSTNVTRNE